MREPKVKTVARSASEVSVFFWPSQAHRIAKPIAHIRLMPMPHYLKNDIRRFTKLSVWFSPTDTKCSREILIFFIWYRTLCSVRFITVRSPNLSYAVQRFTNNCSLASELLLWNVYMQLKMFRVFENICVWTNMMKCTPNSRIGIF